MAPRSRAPASATLVTVTVAVAVAAGLTVTNGAPRAAAPPSPPPRTPGLTVARFPTTTLTGTACDTLVLTEASFTLEPCPGRDTTDGPAGVGAAVGTAGPRRHHRHHRNGTRGTTAAHRPFSVLVTGTIRPTEPGEYGFNVSFDPVMPYPSADAYARLWVDDHLLHPRDTTHLGGRGVAPDWIPLPPNPGLGGPPPPLSPDPGYPYRLEVVCLTECAGVVVTLEWRPPGAPGLAPMPAAAAATAEQLPGERQRRELAASLQRGWGTFYNPSVLAYELLPHAFAVTVGLYRLSTHALLDGAGKTVLVSPDYAIRPGPHAYNQSFTEQHVLWRAGGGVNVSFVSVRPPANPDRGVHLLFSAVPTSGVDAEDYAVVLTGSFVHGRAGEVTARGGTLAGAGAGYARVVLTALNHSSAVDPTTLPGLPPEIGGCTVVLRIGPTGTGLSTEAGVTPAAARAAAAAARAAEVGTYARFSRRAAGKEAMQTSLMWSVIYEPKEGLVAPVTRNWNFENSTIDGDENYVLFCWDGSFASYMLALDAPELAVSNLVQVVKMRTTAGFVPSFSAGTSKTRDRSNPPVTGRILLAIVRRWPELRWVAELLADDLFNWNTWMWRRRRTGAGLMAWGSNPYPYADDGSAAAKRGGGGGAAGLESGLDNGPVWIGASFNRSGTETFDLYDPGYTGLFLMDCRALAALAALLGRDDDAAVFRERFAAVDALAHSVLWNETTAMFNARYSPASAVNPLGVVPHTAPTNFYPLLAGTLSADRAAATVARHLVNRSEFCVWPSADPPADPWPPPIDARPAITWTSPGSSSGSGVDRALCVNDTCNFALRDARYSRVRFEGMALSAPRSGAVALRSFKCDANNDTAVARSAADLGDGCRYREIELEMYVWATQVSAELVELELWRTTAAAGGRHVAVATEASKADAGAAGYTKQLSLGWIYPPPGSAAASCRYGLPSVSKSDPTYFEQNYWRGRIWSPMIQIVYWALKEYDAVPSVRGAREGLVAQSEALVLKEWQGGMCGTSACTGGYVYENFDADTADGYGPFSEAQPLYSWGALAAFVGLQEDGFFDDTAV